MFLCVHNAGRSQMALGWFTHPAGEQATAWSGGSEPGPEVKAAAVAAMAEMGIDFAPVPPQPPRRAPDSGIGRKDRYSVHAPAVAGGPCRAVA